MSETVTPGRGNDVGKYYDKFSEHQQKLGINVRHRTIFRNLKACGLKKNSKVLEVGCGIGTVSSLIASYVTEGFLTSCDISPESIAIARKTFKDRPNVEFVVTDMKDFSASRTYDFIVLPDVLEHIPVEQHNDLFSTLAKASSPKAIMLINIPEPGCLDHIRRTAPEKLQIIDQSLSMQDLLNNSYPHGFRLVSVTPYGLQYKEPEYLSVVMSKKPAADHYTRKSKASLALQELKSRI